MSIRSIIATKKSSTAVDESEIVGYKYYIDNHTSTTYYALKSELASYHHNGDRYFSVSNYGTIEAYWEQSSKGEWYLKTVPDNKRGNNLIELPDC